MSLKKQIVSAMNETTYNSRLTGIADLVGATDEDVRKRMESLSFSDYVELMRALRDRHEDTAKDILGLGVEEAYSTGGTLSPSQMRGGTGAGSTSTQKKAQALQKLGRKNLGGATAQQTATAIDKAEQGKVLNPAQRKAMAQQAKNMDALASDPKTATQFRSLLNKINK